MTTTTAVTRSEPKLCAQSFASIGAIALLVHFIHEGFAVGADLPAAQIAVGLTVMAATLTLVGAWYRLGKPLRRTAAALLGALWVVAASEHVANVVDGSPVALDYTGFFALAGGLILAFAAYWDAHRPFEPTR